ncbi:hypothetical protein Vi05172_g10090 [Venturia inaequalis]|nr:hypothetical protein Vi05172_g10090 [Venturia inaequalis]
MHFASYLFPIAATLPLVFANGCEHYEVTYIIPCPNNICPGGALKDVQPRFNVNSDLFADWAYVQGNGGYCGGKCDNDTLTTIKMGGGAGFTWSMYCHVSRLKKKAATGIPAYREGLERKWEHRKCDVNCSPNGGATVSQDCSMKFGSC